MARTPNFLSLAASYKLMKLIEEEFKAKNMNDTQFAAYATAIIGSAISPNHVRARRTELGVETNRPMNVPIKSREALFELVRELEKRVAKLEAASAR